MKARAREQQAELRAADVAPIVGRSPREVRAMLQRGELPGLKRRDVWVVPRPALDRYIERQALAAEREAAERRAATGMRDGHR